MRFLVDECCPRQFLAALRQGDHQAEHVVDLLQGRSDHQVIDLAIQQNAVVVTLDYDFGELTIRSGLKPAGVVLVASDVPMAERAERLTRLIAEGADLLEGHLTIIGRSRTRRRAF